MKKRGIIQEKKKKFRRVLFALAAYNSFFFITTATAYNSIYELAQFRSAFAQN